MPHSIYRQVIVGLECFYSDCIEKIRYDGEKCGGKQRE